MASNNSTLALQTEANLFVYAIFLLRMIGSSAIFVNLCVLILLVKLKKSFHNYSYWFQILVLSGEDLFNGLASVALSFLGFEIFTNYVACSVLFCAYTFAQINTLMAICCICVNRFRSIQNIKKLGDSKSGYHQEISIALVIVYSLVYAAVPFLALNITTTKLPICAVPPIFGSNTRTYKVLLAVGLALPLIAINIMYGVCLMKLKKLKTAVGPMNQHAKSDLSSCAQITEETYDCKFTTKDNPCHTTTDIFHNNVSFRNFEKESIQKVSNPTNVTNSIHTPGKLQVIGSTRDFPTATEECSGKLQVIGSTRDFPTATEECSGKLQVTGSTRDFPTATEECSGKLQVIGSTRDFPTATEECSGKLQVIGSTRDFPTATEECSTSATDSVLKFGRSNPPKYSKAYKNKRETQYRAIKLLGIILFMSNIATIIPLVFLFRDVIVDENISGGGIAVGMVFLALNSLVDAFVYGLYAVEIRNYIQKKARRLQQLFSCRTV